MSRRPDHFRGKSVWITGASSGIGRALALELGSRGARLLLSARSRDALESVARESGAADVLVLPLDLSELATLPGAAAEVLAWSGGVDVMVHNAGVAVRERAATTDLALHERVLRTNYLGPVVLTRELLPTMIERGGGQFVVLSSLSGQYGAPMLAAYAASKHALHAFFETLRGEERRHGIAVTMIIPGLIRTDITAHALTAEGRPYGRVLPVYRDAMTAEQCARRILQAVEQRRREVLIGGPETWTVRLHRWMPAVAERVIWGHPVRARARLLGWLPVIGARYRDAAGREGG